MESFQIQHFLVPFYKKSFWIFQLTQKHEHLMPGNGTDNKHHSRCSPSISSCLLLTRQKNLKGKKLSNGNPLKCMEAEQASYAIERGDSVTLKNWMSLKV